MASEPSEDAIENFVSFTSTTREQAINFLKANELNSNKAINAYFEDPTGPQIQATSYQNDQNLPSFQVEHFDQAPDSGALAPAAPSRPPSRMNLGEPGPTAEYQAPAPSTTGNEPGLTLSEREERELQQAVAMSLNQNLGQQETGVTTTKGDNLGQATRDHYDEGAWAMTLFNASSQEIIISPDPEDRKRVNNEPAFLRPSPDSQYLGGFLTILHSIPIAREALLFRKRVLSDYGRDPQWWNGQPINLPKVVTMQDAQDADTDWDDIIHETQRLMAFLDSTNRSFGSNDALANLKCMSSTYSPEGSVGRFLETWQESAVRADPGNPLATIFSSNAYKRPLSIHDTPIHKEFFSLDPFVEPEHGQTLYDVLDRTMWADKAGEELDDVWLEHVAEVLTIRLEGYESEKPADVKVPAVFYPDRYLASCREIARDFRAKRLQVYEDISKMERLVNRFSVSKPVVHKGLGSKETLDKVAAAVPQVLANGVRDESLTREAASSDVQRLADELKAISSKIEDKLKELESRKQSALDTLRGYSKFFTEQSASPSEPPYHKYTLRGVCTESHVTYVLRPRENAPNGESRADDEWQWWRISFSTDDAKTRQAESNRDGHAAPGNADVIGYTARKVREIEVLRAAREESKSVLLVYANDNSMRAQGEQIPPPLQQFMDADNQAFEAEFQQTRSGHLPDASGDQGQEVTDTQGFVHPNVNVFDYQVPSFENEAGPEAPEMQEKGGSLLSQGSKFAPVQTGDPDSAMFNVDEPKATE